MLINSHPSNKCPGRSLKGAGGGGGCLSIFFSNFGGHLFDGALITSNMVHIVGQVIK